jgi:periplasmic protein TonB
MAHRYCIAFIALAGCAPLPAGQPSPPPHAKVMPSVPPRVANAASAASLETLHDYKTSVAHRIVRARADTYSHPMPEIMKSVVVLEITIDLLGEPRASVYRSNGYRRLEQRAMASVAQAAPYPLPAPELLQGRGSLTFLETFLFRDDDFFQVRSLVPPGWKPAGHEKLF